MSPSTTGRCYVVTKLSSYWSHEISAYQSPSRNSIRRPGVVERIGSYLGTSFPLFHGWTGVSRDALRADITYDTLIAQSALPLPIALSCSITNIFILILAIAITPSTQSEPSCTETKVEFSYKLFCIINVTTENILGNFVWEKY